jgi:ubiquinone/menaquinone biosynthesis C-methylase UbiE
MRDDRDESDSTMQRLPDSGFRAAIEILKPMSTLQQNQMITMPVKVRNTGSRRWPARGEYPVRLSYHWLRDQEVVVFDGLRTCLLNALAPGDELVLEALIRAPATLGDCTLEFDLVQEFVAWFKDKGSETTKTSVQIIGGRPEDFGDYCVMWKRADLKKDYWSIVGIPSEEEFKRLAKKKLEILINLGLTPTSRILDVGCGSGLLTYALMEYLADDGLYYGTDIAIEAMNFCASKYCKSNILFVQNEPTKLPIDGKRMRFDIIVFFSVFTHTFPDETVSLLKEARRLLDQNGMIVADVFCSTNVNEFKGHRALVELNRDYFLKLIEGCKLSTEIVSEHVHEGATTRLLLKLMLKKDDIGICT